MEVIGYLSGGTALLKKYQVAETFSNAGVPALIDQTTEAGVNLPATDGAEDMVGVTLDTATKTVTQGQGTSSAEALVTIDIRPDAIISMRFSGGATTGTAMPVQTNTTQNTGGVTCTTGATWSSPTYVDGTMWGLSGSNVGQHRKITTVSSTVGTVLIPFDYTLEENDTFLRIPVSPMSSILVQLTSNFLEANVAADIATDAEFLMIGHELNGTRDSYGHFVSVDHILNPI